MTGITVLGRQQKDPPTPPPEYSAVEKMKVEDAACVEVDPVTAALPLLITHAEGICADKADGAVNNNGHTGQLEEEEDPWRMPVLVDNGPAWSDLETCGRLKLVSTGMAKGLALVALLYFFICSLDFLSSGFRLVGGKAAGEAFRSNSMLQNPVAGLMLGILATVLVQSSSTSTSIVVTMVASGIMDVRPAVPIIMGANIGTSVTNTIVSMAQVADKNQFRRAFAGATVHDMFNWLSVIVLLPLEVTTGYLYHATAAATAVFRTCPGPGGANRALLKVITEPFTNLVIQLDKKVLTAMATGNDDLANKSLIKDATSTNVTSSLIANPSYETWCSYEEIVVLVNKTGVVNGTLVLQNTTGLLNRTVSTPMEQCWFLFHNTGLSDSIVGLMLLTLSLVLLCSCLILMVKILHSMLKGRIAMVIKKTLNADFPGVAGYFTGYAAMVVGAGMTILVQSSSVFTSAMTPLVGLGVIEIERMYPLTLGSNIGTTATGVLAALAAPGDKLGVALQIAFAHLFFNISGILLFYPVPAMRIPIRLAKMMGDTTADYRWFAIFYLVVMFFILPAGVFTLSLFGVLPLIVVLSILFVILTVVVVVNVLQRKRPEVLHPRLRTWDFLPEWMHSLDPLDCLLRKVLGLFQRCCPCVHSKKPAPVQCELASERLTVAVEMVDSITPSPNSSMASSQATSVCSSRSTSLLIIPKSAAL